MAWPHRLLLGLLMAWPLYAPQRAEALLMRISNLSDFSLPSWGIGDPAPQASINICIYGLNIPTLTSYAITASSSPAGFKVASGSNEIAYSLYWEDSGAGSLGSTLGTELHDGVKLYPQHNLNILSSSCAITGPTARLTLKISEAAMTAALAGNYTGTITLLLTPN